MLAPYRLTARMVPAPATSSFTVGSSDACVPSPIRAQDQTECTLARGKEERLGLPGLHSERYRGGGGLGCGVVRSQGVGVTSALERVGDDLANGEHQHVLEHGHHDGPGGVLLRCRGTGPEQPVVDGGDHDVDAIAWDDEAAGAGDFGHRHSHRAEPIRDREREALTVFGLLGDELGLDHLLAAGERVAQRSPDDEVDLLGAALQRVPLGDAARLPGCSR